MNILLISPLLTKRPPLLHNIGLTYIGSVLIKEGYSVSFLDIEAYKYTKEEVKTKIKESNADIICMGTLITGFNYVAWLCKMIKEVKPGIPIILGNSIATTVPKIILENIDVDYLVLGEGELTIIELVNSIKNGTPKNNINGIAYKDNDNIIITKERELIKDIDTIPYPAWHLVPFKETYFKVKNKNSKLDVPIGYVITTRGCPYKCTFCYHPFNNQKIRMHSPQRVVNEIKYLSENYKIKTVQFADDLFFAKKSKVYEILDLMDKEKLNLKWRAACRVNLIDEDLIKRIKASGCIELGIGVESGSQIILDNINKQTMVHDAERALSLCKKYNINFVASYMIGNVGETKETVEETVNFRKKYNPGMGGFFYATPYPDTELYYYSLSHNLIEDELSLIKSYGEQSEAILVNLTNMTNKELQNLKEAANRTLIIDYFKKNPVRAGYAIGKSLLNKYLKFHK